jgi:hypothetical protein
MPATGAGMTSEGSGGAAYAKEAVPNVIAVAI